jgi:hypothetical protein
MQARTLLDMQKKIISTTYKKVNSDYNHFFKLYLAKSFPKFPGRRNGKLSTATF